MLMTELIIKKRDGGELTDGEIRRLVKDYVDGRTPDYQMSALLMAIFFQGMSHEETVSLTLATRDSGEVLELSGIPGVKADKHSTGGVGDKVSLILCPMVAACGVTTAKMSGRGLGHTGGTIDKLESFPGFRTDISRERFLKNARDVGLVISGQTGDLAPADKLLYALRDVTGTVESLPLITASVMGKKLASGADVIVLDVKCGEGAFMKTREEAEALARELVGVGRAAGKRCAALITRMDEPLGRAVGNALEVREAIEILAGGEGGELMELCLALGARMLLLAGAAADAGEAEEKLRGAVASGAALSKLEQFVAAQDGDARAVRDVSLLPRAPFSMELISRESGFVSAVDAMTVARACLSLGAGRVEKGDDVDLTAGVLLRKKTGEYVEKGEALATVSSRDKARCAAALPALEAAWTLSAKKPELRPVVIGAID